MEKLWGRAFAEVQIHVLTFSQAELPMMDGARYPQVDIQDNPPAYVSVDVTLNNNGDVYEAVILAGLTTGYVSSSGDTRLSVSGNKDTVAPGVSWWLCNKVVK